MVVAVAVYKPTRARDVDEQGSHVAAGESYRRSSFRVDETNSTIVKTAQ